MSETRIIAVLGATGQQGSGVIRALIEKNQKASSRFLVRAITRDVNSAQAKKLKSQYPGNDLFEVVPGDVYNKDSITKAFQSAYGVFAITNDKSPSGPVSTEDELQHQLDSGRNIIDAAKAANVQHFIFSSLPNLNEASNGRFKHIYHFDHKAQIEKWAKKELSNVTVLHPRNSIASEDLADGTVRFCAPGRADKLIDWVDPTYDIGVFAAEAFAVGPSKTAGKTYPVAAEKITSIGLAQTFKEVTGKNAVFDPLSLDEFGSVVASGAGIGFKRDIEEMMQWIDGAPDEKIVYGTMDPKDDNSWKDLGVKASTFAEFIRRNNWEGPQ